MINYNEQYEKYFQCFEEYVNKTFSRLNGNDKLISAMKYSALSGGKRIRPVLCLAAAELFSVDFKDILPFALAVECVHTYSLIHDDLPAMDNDDMRRGKPSNHKVFGEAFAVLAGDALLNFAFEHSLAACNSLTKVKAVLYLAKASGYNGMIGGQALDLAEGKDFTADMLYTVDKLKTSKLISASLVMPAIIAETDTLRMEALGEKLGIMYQYVDDLLDVSGDKEVLGKTLNKDAEAGKLTALALFGICGVKNKINGLLDECLQLLAPLEEDGFLTELVKRSVSRVK